MCIGMNIFDENGECYFICSLNHSSQKERATTSKHAFAGGDINASLTQEVVELRKEVIGHGTDQLLYLAGKDGGLVSDDLVDIAVFQDPGIERIALARNAVVEGDDPLFKTFDHRQVRTSVTQLENVNGKAANVDDVGNRIGLERTVLCYSSRKCLRIAEDFADADRVVFSIVLEVNGLTAPQKVLLKATVELFIVRRGQSNQ